MNKFIIVLMALALTSPAIAQVSTKIEVETDHCVPMSEVAAGVIGAIPDATALVIGATLVFTSPTKEGNLITYFNENGCYVAYEVVEGKSA